MSYMKQAQEEMWDHIVKSEQDAAQAELMDAGKDLPVVISYGWRFKKLSVKPIVWGVELKDYADRDNVLNWLQLGQQVEATVITRGGKTRKRRVRVTYLAHGQGLSEHPTRADAEILE